MAWDSALKSCRAKPEWRLTVSGFRHNTTTHYNKVNDNYNNNNTVHRTIYKNHNTANNNTNSNMHNTTIHSWDNF